MSKYEISNLHDRPTDGAKMFLIKVDDGRIYIYDYERAYDILTCELDLVIVPTQNFELMNRYILNGYVIFLITELVTRMTSKRKINEIRDLDSKR